MADLVKLTNSKTLSAEQQKTSDLLQSLTQMSLLRGATPTKEQLKLYAQMLTSYPLEPVLQVLKQIGETEREEGKPAFPEYGRIKSLIEEEIHPLKVLRRCVRKLARIFGETPSEEMMEAFELVCWHRIDADIEQAYADLIRDRGTRKMPIPSELLQSCGPLRKSRCAGSDKCRNCIPENDGNLCTGNCPRPLETLGRQQ